LFLMINTVFLYSICHALPVSLTEVDYTLNYLCDQNSS
jgi:hypothetical protein